MHASVYVASTKFYAHSGVTSNIAEDGQQKEIVSDDDMKAKDIVD